MSVAWSCGACPVSFRCRLSAFYWFPLRLTVPQRCAERVKRRRTTAAPGRSGRCCSGHPWPSWSRSSSRCGAAHNAPRGKLTWRISFARASTAGTTPTCSTSPPTAACAPSTSCKALSATAAACAPTSSACAGPTAACPARRSWPPPAPKEPWSIAGFAEMYLWPVTVPYASSSVGPSRSSATSGSVGGRGPLKGCNRCAAVFLRSKASFYTTS